jgi:hypothetical protein
MLKFLLSILKDGKLQFTKTYKWSQKDHDYDESQWSQYTSTLILNFEI